MQMYHAMKMYEAGEVWVLTSILMRASINFIYQLFINGEKAATAHYMEGWVGPRAVVALRQELNLNYPVIQPLGLDSAIAAL